MSQQEIKLKLRSFDHRVLDAAVKDIVGTVKRTGATIKGPIPLPKKIERFTVNRSTHVDKESREQFEIRNHTRLMIIELTTPQTVDALSKLDLASGVDVEIKLIGDEQ
ncbi:30S ribosomal protein S10 [endosymbiont of Acanthamoeba sp. UWC8]|uniref:Small ribosomal subunit protein uS10 n=1 Tax=Candidatus Jidaibacter acanthamoebae TaxID=86105 RepID=A0A0C1MUP8_9RICK|nr:30S ribosomal protein S10 [Candidatus Jidaibacter acanthamoeba]AIF81734.1 30S ribosomal protein S10 [endosymbiont of Acanthamoeba sp. UWC8]KIE05822.1 30S ribosomal protein S10 [Candidatus Jidaibacter acanthamoeba]MBA8667774.1 30S ribosomal protein S10 [Holosporaceae bacterium 'Namur']